MESELRIRCRNNGKQISVPLGSTLSDVYALAGFTMDYGPVSAFVNN